MRDEETISDVYEVQNPLVEQIAREVAGILREQIGPKEVLGLFQILFLDVAEAALLLKVKPKTISTWISQDKIPVRYSGGRPVFLLSELLNWTLPENDKHAAHRLSVAASCTMARNRLTANRQRRVSYVGL